MMIEGLNSKQARANCCQRGLRIKQKNFLIPLIQSLFSLLLLVLSVTKTCLATNMTVHRFSNHPCGDGSPSVIYKSSNGGTANLDHVVVFQGGGACFSDEDCLQNSRSSTNKFSSMNYPNDIIGRTILSDDVNENIDGMDNAAKWFVPYCSQDGYLGVGMDGLGGLKRNGSLQLVQALQYWANVVNSPRRLVLVGISIGVMGILNHIEKVAEIARRTAVSELVIILDSGILSAHQLNLKPNTATYISNLTLKEIHPLCFEHDIYLGTQVSETLPCCLSLTCTLSHTIESKTLDYSKTRMLLINSIYDELELSYIINPQEKQDDSGLSRNIGITSNAKKFASGIDNIWSAGESGGERKHLVQQSIHFAIEKNMREEQALDIMWLSTSCVGHTLLEPAPDLERLTKCNDSKSRCNDTAIGMEFAVFKGLEMTLWKPTLSWTIANINGIAFRSLIADFFSLSHGFGSVVVQDTCHGPNCVDIDKRPGPNQCMDLIDIEDKNRLIPMWAQSLVLFALLAVFAFGFFSRFPALVKIPLKPNKDCKQLKNITPCRRAIPCEIKYPDEACYEPDLEISANAKNATDVIVIAPISVYVKPFAVGPVKRFLRLFSRRKKAKERSSQIVKNIDLPLLKEISFSLPRGKITALTGKSGAGKSTLVSAVMQQVSPNLDFYTTQNLLANYTVVYQRQHANCDGMGRISAEMFLRRNASLYNSTSDRLNEVIKFIVDFKCTAVENLSGGQLRRLELCSALLMKPDILVLDEPLSGLDSISISSALSFLNNIAREDNTAILITVHQPSCDSLVNQFAKLICIEDGEIICNADTCELWGGENSLYGSDADVEVHKLLGRDRKSRLRGYIKDEAVDIMKRMAFEPDSTRGSYQHSRKVLNKASSTFQSIAIQQRLHAENGLRTSDFLRLPLIMILLAAVFQFDSGSPTQLIFVVSCFISVPVNVLRYLIHQHCLFYEMHRNELIDRRISFWAFISGTQPYQFALPTLMLLVSLILCYPILGWSFNTLIVQFLFSALYLLLNMQLGRAVGSYYEGDYGRFAKMYSLMITIATLFGGTVVGVSKLPMWTPWIISHNYWANAGATLDQLQRGPGFGQQPCTSLLSCIFSDPNVVAIHRGYTPYTTTLRSFCIILGLYMLTILAEVLITWRKVHGFARPKTCPPPVPLCIGATMIKRELNERMAIQHRILRRMSSGPRDPIHRRRSDSILFHKSSSSFCHRGDEKPFELDSAVDSSKRE